MELELRAVSDKLLTELESLKLRIEKLDEDTHRSLSAINEELRLLSQGVRLLLDQMNDSESSKP